MGGVPRMRAHAGERLSREGGRERASNASSSSTVRAVLLQIQEAIQFVKAYES